MDEVAEVKNRLEITEVVGAYLPLKQAGRNLKAPCPFHDEKTASFMVSPDKGIYHCFGCGEGGDIFNFVMKMEGLDFRSALEMLARKAGVELKERRGEDSAAKRLRERLLEAHVLAMKYYQMSLVRNEKALEYAVKKRGLGKETIRDFGIGYAPDSWEALTGFLLKKGYTPKELLQGGLAGQKQGRNTIYDLFRARLMFAICDREGRPIGFTGRVLDDSVPKYLNTPQTPLYDKGQVIFGLHLAKEAIRTHDEVVLVEGQMDVVASHQAGVRQVVATSGTALTLDHLRILAKLTKTIKLAFDSDRAGLAATERAIEMGQKLGLTLQMVVLPEGFKDADELIQADAEAWKAAIGGSKYIVDYLFERFERDFDLKTAVGKRGYADRLCASLRRLGDPVEQDHYVRLLAEKTGTSVEAVKAKVAQAEEAAASVEPQGLAGSGASARGRGAVERKLAVGGEMRRPTGSEMATGVEGRGGEMATAPGERARVRSGEGEVVRQAVVRAEGRPSGRVRLEELFLGVTLMNPLARVSLADLRKGHFSTEARRAVFEAIEAGKEQPAQEIIAALGERETYGKQLLLIGENEFGELSDQEQHFEAFALARKVLLSANADFKKELGRRIQEAEVAGDTERVAELMRRYQALIEMEL